MQSDDFILVDFAKKYAFLQIQTEAMNKPLLPLVVASCFVLSSSIFAAITITSPSSDWTMISYEDGTLWYDYWDDTQAGGGGGGANDLDIVGSQDNTTFPSLFYKFDNNGTADPTDGELAFRIRMSEQGQQAYFKGYAWIGMDIDGALNVDGKRTVDLVVGFEGTSQNTNILMKSAGLDANVGPSSTSFIDLVPPVSITGVENSNFSFADVADIDGTGTDLDNDGADFFLSFKIDFSFIVTAVESEFGTGFIFDDTTLFSIVAATSTQGNALNADLNGVDGTGGDWEFSDPIPEPSTYALVFGFAALCFFGWRRWRNQR